MIETYFANEDRFPAPSDIARQTEFLLGGGNAIPWLFKNGPDLAEARNSVSASITEPGSPLTWTRQELTGFYRSPFIVETLAVYFERSSVQAPTATQVHPVGALALTLTAVMSHVPIIPS